MNADRSLLTAAQWARLSPLWPGQAHTPGVTAQDTRLFVEAIPWRLRCGVAWRDLPERLGPWHRVVVRFSRWKNGGVWAKARAAMQDDSGLNQLMVDSTVVRARQHSAGALKKRPAGAWPQPEWLLYQTTRELRRAGPAPATGPDRGPGWRLPPGPRLACSGPAPRSTGAGDRAYDADYLRAQILAAKAQVVISSKKNRNQIERCFNRFKAYRAIATRFDKTATAYLALVTLAAIRMWL